MNQNKRKSAIDFSFASVARWARGLAPARSLALPLGLAQARGLALTLTLVWPTTSHAATTYYVAPDGSDSQPGTEAEPFATLQHAHDLATAGDTIYLRGGIYNLIDSQTLSRSGSPGNPIRVFNFPGETPVFDGSQIQDDPSGDGKWIITLDWNSAWWHIRGIELRNNPRGGGIVGRSCQNVVIEQNHVHHNGFLADWEASGIALYYEISDCLVLNNDVHHNADVDFGDGDGIQIAYSAGAGNVIQGNRSWRNSDDGIDLWNSANVTLKDNWSFGNGLTDNLQPLGNGVGFKLGGSGAGDGAHTLTNNVAWKNGNNGFDFNSADLPIVLYNNTAWSNGVVSGEEFYFDGASHTLHNNLAFGTVGTISGSEESNSWTLPITVDAADFQSLDDTLALGPRSPQGLLPRCTFLRLAPGSDCINQGLDVGLPYHGSAPDLGAFETGRFVGVPEERTSDRSQGNGLETPRAADHAEGLTLAPPAAAPLSSLSIRPNPSRGMASISFVLSRSASVELSVFDISGRRVDHLTLGQFAAGEHDVVWNGRGIDGRPFPAGVYAVRVSAGEATSSGKFMVLR